MLLTEFAEKHYFPHVKKTVRETTYVGYWSSYVRYVRPGFSDVDMDGITVLHIENWIDSIEKPGAAAKAFKVLRQIMRRADYCDMLNIDDPTEKHIKLPKTEGNQNKILTADEVKELLAGFRGHILEPCVLCAVTLGLRRCESFGLLWEDIDFETGDVFVHRSVQYINGHEVCYPTKTKLSTRHVYLPPYALQRLSEIREESGPLLKVPVREAPVLYKKHIQENDLPYTPFMNLRHTYATLALESGADILLIAKMLGHTDLEMAYKRYVKPSKQAYMSAQNNMQDLIAPPEKESKPTKSLFSRLKTKVLGST